ncbi:MAG: TauD/TfdA family dioxygenase, partial [Candidatus Hydrogenedentes bacterium]|nr:TauD/TfdA family dioxygenase [Candidatus Hydrogenedentota bacterium]
EGDSLLQFLCEPIHSPQLQCRVRWEPDPIAFWDDRSVQHLAISDDQERRVMHHAALRGDVLHSSSGAGVGSIPRSLTALRARRDPLES